MALFWPDMGRIETTIEPMEKGQAERLMPLIQDLLARHDVTLQDLTALGVAIGPGNFTGIRIGVAAARGMALGLNIPAIGVSGFDVLRHDQPQATALITAPRNMAYVQNSDAGPELVATDPALTGLWLHDLPLAEQITRIAQIAAMRGHHPQPRPAPLYIRPADAAPPADPPPVILP
ncbi:tRNA (adenosine(37)-N6)-threonylcarbamoyltransferase complex dimerization subunit type 1 TsaB [Neogemmobacter tilapiae]|uniref:tRNA (adenosine(37)-N6)-threonylcarbamoyltransferase complex dimerization subunit type 1 TsaB n=1 Tax=Neogemmobacter tilapiae TaxID=875041 RepID=UPI001E5EE33E|nr:tRNA (adenosine(37)-N6)-threonylcarbamoyltransferase complex dimerization subunit type 1 TsaB [Gemmobacter tilapiae]